VGSEPSPSCRWGDSGNNGVSGCERSLNDTPHSFGGILFANRASLASLPVNNVGKADCKLWECLLQALKT